MKKVLGLDLGTNSIGWALITEGDSPKIVKAGSRIIPMDAAVMGNFEKGSSISQTAERTRLRGVRRLRQRCLLRRERLHRVLDILGFLPEHYTNSLILRRDNHPNKKYGHIVEGEEPKLAWRKNEYGEFEFIFKESFNEMIAEFKRINPQLFVSKTTGRQLLIPYDWTLYYLRKKALTQKISEQELAWILLNFNHKRGYNQLRGEDEEQEGKVKEYHVLKVVDVQATDQKKGEDVWYNVILENGWIYRRPSSYPLDWVGRKREFIVTTDVEKDGSPKLNKNGEVKRSLSSPKDEDWGLIKTRTETEISMSGLSVGEYIYRALLADPKQKINGKLVRVIERKFYKDELKQIIDTQLRFYEIFNDKAVLQECIDELYPINQERRRVLQGKGLKYLLIDDLLFYQRPLKSKKSLIANCQYEQHKFVEKESGKIMFSPVKAIPKSNPLFQEFRLWQFVSNLKLYRIEGAVDVDVTSQFIPDMVEVFDWLCSKKEISQKTFLARKEFGIKKKDQEKYRWNYVPDKDYPCCETSVLISNRLEKAGLLGAVLNKRAFNMALWHILYSVSNLKELEKALESFAKKTPKIKIDTRDEKEAYKEVMCVDKFVAAFKKSKPFASDYGSYSEKAINKLLPLMKQGKHWSEEAIDVQTRGRIDKIINGEFDADIDDAIRQRCKELTEISHFQGLPLHLACYVVYGRHSEVGDITKWNSPEDIDKYLSAFRQHSLNNPIVEQVVTETLRIVRDIWIANGNIDEIHIELGRDLKNPAAKRKYLRDKNQEDENTNLRIRKLLEEFVDPQYQIENVRPYSPSQQSILKIYEDGALNSCSELPEYIKATLKMFKEKETDKQPKQSDVMCYKLWLEQNYRSPYTGKMIPLGKLFTTAYQIEHIIPQSRFFDDSLSNKVICESEVNGLKGRLLPVEFISNSPRVKIELSGGNNVTLFNLAEYTQFVTDHYSNNKEKMKRLLMTEIPESFSSRQLNDTRYISKLIMGLLSNIVREKEEKEATSKNVIVCSGGVTSKLKQEWGLNDVWNDIVYERFERLNKITNSESFGGWINKDGKRYFQTAMPIDLSKGFRKKRIDHRHHALDAIVVACATRNHINYLNNVNSGTSLRYDLKHTLCFKTKPDADGHYQWRFHKPWDRFTEQALDALRGIVVGFKQNLRVINKNMNKTLHYSAEGKKTMQEQVKGENWAIRKSLHVPMPYGRITCDFDVLSIWEHVGERNLIIDDYIRSEVCKVFDKCGGLIGNTQKAIKEEPICDQNNFVVLKTAFKIKVEKYRKRKPICEIPNNKTAFDQTVKFINKVADQEIRKSLLEHLERCDRRPDIAFNPDGIEKFNSTRKLPVHNLPIAEGGTTRFQLGERPGSRHKFVEADACTNLFYAVYQNEVGARLFQTIPLNVVIERQKCGLGSVPEVNENGDKLLFALSPNDLVYLPTPEQVGCNLSVEDIDVTRIYKMMSSSGSDCFFVPHHIAHRIVDTRELGSNNKSEKSWDGEMIKASCILLNVNRLGDIVKIIQ